MISQITKQLRLPLDFIETQLSLPFAAVKRISAKAVCLYRGHRFSTPVFSNYFLSFCSCCGKEIADRLITDVLPVPSADDIEWLTSVDFDECGA